MEFFESRFMIIYLLRLLYADGNIIYTKIVTATNTARNTDTADIFEG